MLSLAYYSHRHRQLVRLKILLSFLTSRKSHYMVHWEGNRTISALTNCLFLRQLAPQWLVTIAYRSTRNIHPKICIHSVTKQSNTIYFVPATPWGLNQDVSILYRSGPPQQNTEDKPILKINIQSEAIDAVNYFKLIDLKPGPYAPPSSRSCWA